MTVLIGGRRDNKGLLRLVVIQVLVLSLFLTLFVSTLIFRFGIGTGWADGLYQTVTVVATGSELHGEHQPGWVKVFLSLLKIAGAALLAGFTAIFTNYLLKARLGGDGLRQGDGVGGIVGHELA